MEQQLPPGRVTCILTSCGRFDLLAITLESFFKFNTYPLSGFIVYDDSGEKIPDELKDLYPVIKWHGEKEKIGQIEALDFLWSLVKTEYAFTMEDDWETLKGGFIEESIKVLNKHSKALQVWMIQPEHNNQHPIEWHGYYGILKYSLKVYSGIRFNPSVKRKLDYDLIAPFGKHTVFNIKKAWKSETIIAKIYTSLGFYATILPDIYIKHIGKGRHVE